jgi:hypothetical protein
MQCRQVSVSRSETLRAATRPALRPLPNQHWNEGRGAGASLPPVLVVLMLAAMLVPSAAPAKSIHPDYLLLRGEVQQYGDWLVGCDNTASCTILGFPRPVQAIDSDAPAAADMAIRISYSGPAGTPPLVELLPIRQAEEARIAVTPRPDRFKLSAGGRPAGGPFGYSAAALDQPDAGFVLHALEQGVKLTGFDPQTGKVAIRFPADHYGAALRALQSRRAGLLRQLPDGSTMAVPQTYTRFPAKPVIVSGFVPILFANSCQNSRTQDLRAYRFAGGAMLWSYLCDDRTDPPRSYWQMAPSSMSKAAPLDLPEPRGGRVAAGVDGLAGPVFDFDFGILRSYQFHSGRDDCGIMRAWGYTHHGWQLLERREMPICMGLQPDQWIRTHYTPSNGVSPHE